MGEAAVKLRMLKAKHLQAADDYNAEQSDDELAQVAAKCSDPEGWKATSQLVGLLGRDRSCVRKS